MNYCSDKNLLFSILSSNNVCQRHYYDGVNYGFYLGNYKNKYYLFLKRIEELDYYDYCKYYKHHKHNCNKNLFINVLNPCQIVNIPTLNEIKFLTSNSHSIEVLNRFLLITMLDYNKVYLTVDNLYYFNYDKLVKINTKMIVITIDRVFIK